jgi:hypothetical protein
MAEKNPTREPVVEWTRVLGGALAAVSSAVLLSTLGAVGTIVGAALGSIVVSVATSLYAHGLRRSRQRMAQAQEAARRRVSIAQAEVRRARRGHHSDTADAQLERADEDLAEARDELSSETPSESREAWGERLRRLPWNRVALVAALMFVIAIAAVTAFELVAGRPVSSFTGGTHSHQGTSFSNLGNGRSHSGTPSAPPSSSGSPSSSPGESPSANPSTVPTSPASPSSAPTTSPAPSQTPTEEPTPSLSEPTPGG